MPRLTKELLKEAYLKSKEYSDIYGLEQYTEKINGLGDKKEIINNIESIRRTKLNKIDTAYVYKGVNAAKKKVIDEYKDSLKGVIIDYLAIMIASFDLENSGLRFTQRDELLDLINEKIGINREFKDDVEAAFNSCRTEDYEFNFFNDINVDNFNEYNEDDLEEAKEGYYDDPLNLRSIEEIEEEIKNIKIEILTNRKKNEEINNPDFDEDELEFSDEEIDSISDEEVLKYKELEKNILNDIDSKETITEEKEVIEESKKEEVKEDSKETEEVKEDSKETEEVKEDSNEIEIEDIEETKKVEINEDSNEINENKEDTKELDDIEESNNNKEEKEEAKKEENETALDEYVLNLEKEVKENDKPDYNFLENKNSNNESFDDSIDDSFESSYDEINIKQENKLDNSLMGDDNEIEAQDLDNGPEAEEINLNKKAEYNGYKFQTNTEFERLFYVASNLDILKSNNTVGEEDEAKAQAIIDAQKRIDEFNDIKNGFTQQTYHKKFHGYANRVVDEACFRIHHEDQKEREKAKNRLISTYAILREKKDQRTFFDVIIHPFQTYYCNKLMNECADILKTNCNVKDNELDHTYKLLAKKESLNEFYSDRKKDLKVIANKLSDLKFDNKRKVSPEKLQYDLNFGILVEKSEQINPELKKNDLNKTK